MISILATFPPIVCVILSFSFVPVFVFLWFSSFGYVYRHAWFLIHCDSRLLFVFLNGQLVHFALVSALQTVAQWSAQLLITTLA